MPPLRHCIACIHHKIHHNLFKLALVCTDHVVARGMLKFKLHPLAHKPVQQMRQL